MSDLISRQATIDAFYKYPNVNWTTLDVLNILSELPSEQPEFEKRTAESAQNVPNGELISRKAVIEALTTYIHNVDRVIGTGKLSMYDCRDAAESVIEELPSAQPDFYDYSDIEPLWESFAKEHDVNLTDGAKQLKDAMWAGYRKGKADAQPEQRWIPVSEKMPEKGGYYLVTCGDTDRSIEVDSYYKKSNSFLIYNVIAWMPLPEPWKGEEHG